MGNFSDATIRQYGDILLQTIDSEFQAPIAADIYAK
jgi:hypothetical protein